MTKIKRSQVEDWDINRIIPYGNNAKLHPEQQVEQIAASIEEFSFLDPIAVDEKGEILEGHGRWLAAKKRGDASLPVIQIEGLSKEQKIAYRLAHNKLTINSGFDPEMLREDFNILIDADFNLDLTGFADWEINLEEEEEDPDENPEEKDEVPEAGQVEPRVKPGEIWQLGDHFIACGDCTVEGNMAALLAHVGGEAHMVWTDPPYNVDYDPEDRVCNFSEERLNNPIGKIANDKMSDAQFSDFLRAAYTAINNALIPGSPIYICHADIQGHHFRANFVKQPWKLQSCLIWVKTVFTFGRCDYHWKHEPILYGWKEGAAHRYYGDRTQHTLLEYHAPHYDRENNDIHKYVHSCQKPLPLINHCLVNSSIKGQVVLDPFLGSASTLIAVEKLGDRRCIGFEISPDYCEVICQRYENFTGNTPKKVGSLS
jgi:DNA modification methylase